MKLIIILFLIKLLNVSANPFKNLKSFSGKLSGGFDAEPNQFPYLVSIINGDQFLNIYMHVCENPLITETWILTHRKCKVPIGRAYAQAGLLIVNQFHTKTELPGYRYAIENSIWADDYYRHHKNHLLGLYQLKSRITVPTVKPARILTHPNNLEATVLGWDIDQAKTQMKLQYSVVSTIDRKFCVEKAKDACENQYEISEVNFCTDDPSRTGASSHNFDTGSPVQAYEGVIVGIVYDAKNELMEDCPGIHLLISSERDFIDNYVDNVTWIE